MDLLGLMMRYIGRHISISTLSHGKVVGEVASVGEDCVRLINSIEVGELDDQGWFSQIQHADPDSVYGPRNPETLVHTHAILSVTCFDEDICDVPESGVVVVGESQSEEADHTSDVGSVDKCAIDEALDIDSLKLLLGVGLIRLVDSQRGGDLLNRIGAVRKDIASKLGIVIPKVRVRDDFQLDHHAYSICISGCEVARSMLPPDRLLAIEANDKSCSIVEGDETTDPAFGLRAVWIDPDQSERAELAGYSVHDSSTVVATHLAEIVKRHAAEILSYDDVRALVEKLRVSSPTLVEQIVPDVVSIRTLHRVLYRLLEEQVSIQSLGKILEALGDVSDSNSNIDVLVAAVRRRIGRIVCEPYENAKGEIHAITVDEEIEKLFLDDLSSDNQLAENLTAASFVALMRERWEILHHEFLSVVILVSDLLRLPVSRAINNHEPRVAVLAMNEIPHNLKVKVVETIWHDKFERVVEARGDVDGGECGSTPKDEHEVHRPR